MTIYVVYEKNQYSCDPEKDKALFHCSTKAKALKMIKHYLNEKVKNGDFMGAPRFLFFTVLILYYIRGVLSTPHL